jgi:osmotically-inducible protein OsmY
MNTSSSRIASAAFSTIAAVALLAGCNRQADNRTAGERADDTVVAQAEQRSAEINEQAREAGQAASATLGRPSDQGAGKTSDLGITAEMKARLAKDRQLSALRIEVDTREGRVVLRGAAPTLAARERATELARGIDGVMGVENELQIQAPTNPS